MGVGHIILRITHRGKHYHGDSDDDYSSIGSDYSSDSGFSRGDFGGRGSHSRF